MKISTKKNRKSISIEVNTISNSPEIKKASHLRSFFCADNRTRTYTPIHSI